MKRMESHEERRWRLFFKREKEEQAVEEELERVNALLREVQHQSRFAFDPILHRISEERDRAAALPTTLNEYDQAPVRGARRGPRHAAARTSSTTSGAHRGRPRLRPWPSLGARAAADRRAAAAAQRLHRRWQRRAQRRACRNALQSFSSRLPTVLEEEKPAVEAKLMVRVRGRWRWRDSVRVCV